jgi:hypothetical protein
MTISTISRTQTSAGPIEVFDPCDSSEIKKKSLFFPVDADHNTTKANERMFLCNFNG